MIDRKNMNQFESTALRTDPLLRQSVEAMGMPEPLHVNFPERTVGILVAGSILTAGVIGGAASTEKDVAEAAFDNRVQANQVVTLDFGKPNVAINGTITSTQSDAAGYATLFPCNEGQPDASNLNYRPGVDVADLFMQKTDSAGKLCAYVSATTHLLVDVAGIATPEATAGLGMQKPNRMYNSRSTGKVAAGQVVKLPFGRPNVAVSGTLTATQEDAPGYITAFPCNEGQPDASNLNYIPGVDVANAFMQKTDSEGNLCLYTYAPTHLLVDVAGIATPEATAGLGMQKPNRMYNSRNNVEPGVPIVRVSGAIGEVIVQAVCDNATGNDYVGITNVGSTSATAVFTPSADAQFQLLNNSVNIGPGGVNTGFNFRTLGTKPTISFSNMPGIVSVDLTPCGIRPPIITPSVTGVISDIFTTRNCNGPSEGAVTLYTNDRSAASYNVRVDIGNDGTNNSSPILRPASPLYLTQSYYSDIHTVTVDGKSGSLKVDYAPCRVLPAGHNGNTTQYPL